MSRRPLFSIPFVVAVTCLAAASGLAGAADEPVARDATPKVVRLPGLELDLAQRHVDVDAEFCLDEGYLELIACTAGTKEHESLVVIDAEPKHVHAALLLLGATCGNPALNQRVGDDDPRWVYLPPRGDPVVVTVIVADAQGQAVERPLGDFIIHQDDLPGDGMDTDQTTPAADPGERDREARRFPSKFLFAGSRLVETPTGATDYLADDSGDVVSVASFGDEVLCLPGEHSADNGALVWRVNPAAVPAVGTRVKLRLTLSKTTHPE